MTVYVDDYRAPYRGMIMSHLFADTPEELFAMVDAIGVKRKWFQNGSSPHFDVCESKRLLAISYGVTPIACKDRKAWASMYRPIRDRFRSKESRKPFLEMMKQ